MSKDTIDVALEPVKQLTQLVRLGFPQGSIELKVTASAATQIMQAFLTGGPIGLNPEDADLKMNATFVGINSGQVHMLEIIPIPKAPIIQARVPKLIIPGGISE